jgi:predicted nucleic acid-binding protein
VLSEDLQDGFTWHGVTVVNPFRETPHHLLAALIGA